MLGYVYTKEDADDNNILSMDDLDRPEQGGSISDWLVFG